MASFSLRIQVGEVVQTLRILEAGYHDATPFMDDVLLLMIRSAQLTFEAQGRPEAWAKLAPSTIARRMRKLGSTTGKKIKSGTKAFAVGVGNIQILRDTGLLYQSIGGNATGPFETAGGFGLADARSAIIGTNRPGADALQLGNPARNLPDRPYLLIQPQDDEDIVEFGVQWMLRVGPYAA